MSWTDIMLKEKEDLPGRYDVAQDFTINYVEGIQKIQLFWK